MLTIDSSADTLILAIPDSKKRMQRYHCVICRKPRFVCTLTKGGTTYTIKKSLSRFDCDCPDRRKHLRPCKHAKTIKELYDFIRILDKVKT